MKWRVEFRPEVEEDVASAATWYEAKQPGLGAAFVEEVIQVWGRLAENPLLDCRRHLIKNIRWRYPDRFPYRIIYELRGTNTWLSSQPSCMPPVMTATGGVGCESNVHGPTSFSKPPNARSAASSTTASLGKGSDEILQRHKFVIA